MPCKYSYLLTLTLSVGRQEGHPACKKLGAGVVICLERGADLHMARRMQLPLTVSCFGKIQIGFTFLVPYYPGSPGQRAVKRVCVCYLLTQSTYVQVRRWSGSWRACSSHVVCRPHCCVARTATRRPPSHSAVSDLPPTSLTAPTTATWVPHDYLDSGLSSDYPRSNKLSKSVAALAESSGRLPPGLWLTSRAGWLQRIGISSGTLRSAIEYGLPLP